MRSIFKLLDIIFIFLGLPYLYDWVLQLIHHSPSSTQGALFILWYLLITCANYRDKWNEKEKKGIVTYPLLVTIFLSSYFQLEIALVGGFLTLLALFFKPISTIFISGGLLSLWVFSFLETKSISSLWNIASFENELSGWKIIFPLLAGWIYLKVMGRFYPEYLKHEAPKKKSFTWLRSKAGPKKNSFTWWRFKQTKLFKKRKKSLIKGRSLFRKKLRSKPVVVQSQRVGELTPGVESVLVRQVVSLVQEMTKEKGVQWTSAAREAIYKELQPFIGTWREDRFYLWARRFVHALDQDVFIIDSHTVHRTFEKLKKSS